MKPQARTSEVLVQKVGGEWVLYDRQRHEAHRLNATAGTVWEHSDGTRTEEDLAAVLGARLGVPADEELVRLAIGELDRAGLLLTGQLAVDPLSRREALGRLRKAAYLLPVVVSMVAPTPLAAESDDDDDGISMPTSPTVVTPPTTPTNTSAPPTTPTPPPTTTPNRSGTFSMIATRQSQSGTCNFLPNFSGRFIFTENSNGTCTAQVVEQATRSYSGTIDSAGAFTCSGNNSFQGCTQSNGTVRGTVSSTSCNFTETLPLSGCCSGTVVYSCTAFK